MHAKLVSTTTSSRLLKLNQLIDMLKLPPLNSKNKIVFGISGFPGAGKTTLTKELQQILTGKGYNVIVIHQDDFRIAKKGRINEDGTYIKGYLTLHNLWHNWTDMERLLSQIMAQNSESYLNAMTYDSFTSERTHEKSFLVKDYGNIILVEGAFIFDVGSENIYGAEPNILQKYFTNSIFTFRGTPTKFDKEILIKPIYEREKQNNPQKSNDENYLRASELVSVFVDDIEIALKAWQQAPIYFDNSDLNNPNITFY